MSFANDAWRNLIATSLPTGTSNTSMFIVTRFNFRYVLLAGETHLWTFVRVEGVEPTNNDAERALRHGVIYRKLSGGTDSEAGSRFVERMLSVVATCRQQDINVLDYLTRCYQAHLDGQPAPSLLPATSTAQAA